MPFVSVFNERCVFLVSSVLSSINYVPVLPVPISDFVYVLTIFPDFATSSRETLTI